MNYNYKILPFTLTLYFFYAVLGKPLYQLVIHTFIELFTFSCLYYLDEKSTAMIGSEGSFL